MSVTCILCWLMSSEQINCDEEQGANNADESQAFSGEPLGSALGIKRQDVINTGPLVSN